MGEEIWRPTQQESAMTGKGGFFSETRGSVLYENLSEPRGGDIKKAMTARGLTYLSIFHQLNL